MFCISDFILFDGIGEKPSSEHHESNSNKGCDVDKSLTGLFSFNYRDLCYNDNNNNDNKSYHFRDLPFLL